MSSSLFGLWALSSMEATAGRLAFLSGVIRARPPGSISTFILCLSNLALQQSRAAAARSRHHRLHG